MRMASWPTQWGSTRLGDVVIRLIVLGLLVCDRFPRVCFHLSLLRFSPFFSALSLFLFSCFRVVLTRRGHRDVGRGYMD